MQWGTDDGGTITFPIAFPTVCLNVVGTPGMNTENENEAYKIGSITTTSFYHQMKDAISLKDCTWQAIGY